MIDVYQGRRQPERHFGIFAVFVSFFPIVLSGPIERASHLLPQLQRNAAITFTYENISQGVKLIIWGLFLKLVIADRAALYVDAVFGNPARHSGVTFLAATSSTASRSTATSRLFLGGHRLGQALWHRHPPEFQPALSGGLDQGLLATMAHDPLHLASGLRIPAPAYALSGRLPEGAIRDAPSGQDHLCRGHLPDVRSLRPVARAECHVSCVGMSARPLSRRRERRQDRPGGGCSISGGRTVGPVSWVFFRADTVSDALDILGKIVTAPGRLFIPPGPDVVAPLYAIGGIGLLIAIELKREFYRGRWTFFGHPNEYVRVLAYPCSWR